MKLNIQRLLILYLFSGTLLSNCAAYVADCRTDQLYNTYRQVCIDLCGDDTRTVCLVEEYCSSNTVWANEHDPPICLKRCDQFCKETSYCDPNTAICRPCASVCDGSDINACRAYCYDVFLTLPSTEPQPVLGNCNINQYYDDDRKVCLDRCGDDNEIQCSVDQFCSTTVPWAATLCPPLCLNHCAQQCDGVTYCDRISHRCLPCDNLCKDTKDDECRVFCNDVFVQGLYDGASTTEKSAIILPAEGNTSYDMAELLWGLLSLTILIILIVFVIVLCDPTKRQQLLENLGLKKN